MEKEKIIASIGNINQLRKTLLFINNIQDNYNKIISSDDAEEQAFLCQVGIKLLEMSGEIIKDYEGYYLKLFDDINGELEKKHNLSVYDYIENILNESTEIFGISCKSDNIFIGDTNEYKINTNDNVEWKLTNNSGGLTIAKTEGNKCYVKCEDDKKLYTEKETLTAIVNGKKYSKEIIIVGLF
jgi:hypothetical protein